MKCLQTSIVTCFVRALFFGGFLFSGVSAVSAHDWRGDTEYTYDYDTSYYGGDRAGRYGGKYDDFSEYFGPVERDRYGDRYEYGEAPIVVDRYVGRSSNAYAYQYGRQQARPRSCGEFHYWDGHYCTDARKHPPYVGPKW